MTNDGPAAPTAPAEGRQPRRAGKVLVVVLAFLVALGAVAGGTLLFLYDRATAIDRSTPQVVTDQFLEAALVLKDPGRVALFTCDDLPVDSALTKLSAPVHSRMSVSWGVFVQEVADGNAVVTARITFRFPDSRRQVDIVTLDLTDEGGWRVCDVAKESSL